MTPLVFIAWDGVLATTTDGTTGTALPVAAGRQFYEMVGAHRRIIVLVSSEVATEALVQAWLAREGMTKHQAVIVRHAPLFPDPVEWKRYLIETWQADGNDVIWLLDSDPRVIRMCTEHRVVGLLMTEPSLQPYTRNIKAWDALVASIEETRLIKGKE